MTPSTDLTSHALDAALRWLTAHAGFPARRLPVKAELLVLLAAVATEGQRPPPGVRHTGQGGARGPSTGAQLRTYMDQRRRVHIKCDNSAKV